MGFEQMYKLIVMIILVFVVGCGSQSESLAPSSDINRELTTVEKEKDKAMDFDLQWGGYYACRDADSKLGEYSIIRMLDFNSDAYHVALYDESFNGIPALKTVQQLSPKIGHVPIDARGLLNYEEITLLGGPTLTEDDLFGYNIYLEHHDVPTDEINALVHRLIGFGEKELLRIRLTVIDDVLHIEER